MRFGGDYKAFRKADKLWNEREQRRRRKRYVVAQAAWVQGARSRSCDGLDSRHASSCKDSEPRIAPAGDGASTDNGAAAGVSAGTGAVAMITVVEPQLAIP